MNAVAGSRRAATTLMDQAFSSASNFAVGVAVARVAGAAGLGAFAFAYVGWVVLSDMHRSLITDPMNIEGDARRNGNPSIERGFAAEVLLGSGAAAVFALLGGILLLFHAHTFATATLFLAPWMPALFVQDYWRNVAFMIKEPGLALANDTVFNLTQAAAFAAIFVAHVHSITAVITAWGMAGFAGAIYGLYQFRVIPTLRGGLSLIRSRWGMSKWLAATSFTNWGSNQANLYIAGAILGPAGLGGLKAVQSLVGGPVGVLIQAGGSIGLAEASHAYAEKGWKGLVKVSRAVTAAGVLSFAGAAVVIFFWGRALLSMIYGPQFAHLEGAAVLIAFGYILTGFWLGPVLVLKQTRNTHRLFFAQIVTLVVSLSTVTVLTLHFGLTGAAWATIATGAAAAVSVLWNQHVVRRSSADQPPVPSLEAADESASLEPAGESASPSVVAQAIPPPPAISWMRAAVLRRRLKRPTPALLLVERQLSAHLESAASAALAVVEINAAEPAALAMAALARSLVSEGKRVLIADAAYGRPLAALLGDRRPPGTVRTVSVHGTPVPLLVAPDDPAHIANAEAGEDADAILILATVDPARGADHISAWASDAVVMLRAGQVSAAWIDAVRHRLRQADMTVKSAVLIDADADNHSYGAPSTYQLFGDPTELRLTTALRAAGG